MTTFVLIHGAYQGGWIWKPVVAQLIAGGHRVLAPIAVSDVLPEPMTSLQTPRLRLTPYRQTDIDGLYAVMSDERVMRHVGNGAMSRAEVIEMVARVEKRWESIGMGWWTIRSKDNDRVLGQMCLQPARELPETEVGYGLAAASWGQGVAKEALTEVLRYAREEKKLSSVVATVRPENFHSIGLLVRSGFALETTLYTRGKALSVYRRVLL
jgi:[ribosomal protein S5]-alanine N-acetyltransferase